MDGSKCFCDITLYSIRSGRPILSLWSVVGDIVLRTLSGGNNYCGIQWPIVLETAGETYKQRR